MVSTLVAACEGFEFMVSAPEVLLRNWSLKETQVQSLRCRGLVKLCSSKIYSDI